MYSSDVGLDTLVAGQDLLNEFFKRKIPVPLPKRAPYDLTNLSSERESFVQTEPSTVVPGIKFIAGYVNNYPDIDKLLQEMNQSLQPYEILLGKMRTIHYYKRVQLKTWLYGKGIYYCSAFFHRVFPKLNWFCHKFYHRCTKGNNQRLSKTEIIGRLIKSGFDVQRIVMDDNGELFFYAEKKRVPDYSTYRSYWPILKLKRIGKGGKEIFVYKIRTMHPYSEYVQDYIKQLHGLEKSGKFLNDFRVASWGKFLRKCWLDELPMLLNLIKGDIKLVGVRPISAGYLNLYPDELKKIRNRFKPGLLPPYYADMPGNFDEILESEKRYLEQYEKNPFKTDLKYFFAIFRNIIFRRARSK